MTLFMAPTFFLHSYDEKRVMSYQQSILDTARQSNQEIPLDLLQWTTLIDTAASGQVTAPIDGTATATAFESFQKFLEWVRLNNVSLTKTLPDDILLQVVETLIRSNRLQPEQIQILVSLDKRLWGLITHYSKSIWKMLIETHFPSFKRTPIVTNMDRNETVTSLKERFFALRLGRHFWEMFATWSSTKPNFDASNLIQSIGNEPYVIYGQNLLELLAQDDEALPQTAEHLMNQYIRWRPATEDLEEMEIRRDIVYRIMEYMTLKGFMRVYDSRQQFDRAMVVAPLTIRLRTAYDFIDPQNAPDPLVSEYLTTTDPSTLLTSHNMQEQLRQEASAFSLSIMHQDGPLSALIADWYFHRMVIAIGTFYS